MEERKWVNQYIGLASEYPGMLANGNSSGYDPADLELFSQKLASFSSLCVEIGSGSGGHLIEQAARTPETFWVGIELRYKRAVRTVQKAQEKGLNNLFVFRGRAEGVKDIIQDASVDTLYINFPDPWAKKKWKKHRILSDEYLAVIHSLLKPTGYLSFKTDHQEYFRTAKSRIQNSELLDCERHTEDLHNSDLLSENIMSEFEMLFKSKGLPVCYLEARKIST